MLLIHELTDGKDWIRTGEGYRLVTQNYAELKMMYALKQIFYKLQKEPLGLLSFRNLS